jgi:4-hydroxy-tetrahydrodipicolinate synthase
VVYNVPGRTGSNLTPAQLARLWEHPQVVAVKESSGSLGQIGQILAELPPGKAVLAGDDNLALATIAQGGAGLISVTGNLLPAPMAALVAHARAGRLDEARALHAALLPVMDALFAESNPIPVKAGLALLGLGGEGLRLPLTTAQPATRARLAAALAAAAAALEDGVRPAPQAALPAALRARLADAVGS